MSLLPPLALNALLALLASAFLSTGGLGAPQLAAHVAFALGILPLILAAMAYFVPVLTRGAGAGALGRWPPLLAWAGGGLAVWAFATDFVLAKLHPAATLAGLGALMLGIWTLRRARAMFGPRHPGLDWYLAALGFLVLALFAVLLMPAFPAQRQALRLFHLHANLLGFVGLTALGTLQVLLPTCLGQADPEAVLRLRRDLKWAVGGALVVALAVSSAPTLAALGALAYLVAVLRMVLAWRRRFGRALLAWHGAAPSLLAATAGLCGLMGLGVLHGVGLLAARPAVAGFVLAFLLPLVSGAAAYLLPIWWRPGPQGDWHWRWRARLTRWGGLRGLAFFAIGMGVSLYGALP